MPAPAPHFEFFTRTNGEPVTITLTSFVNFSPVGERSVGAPTRYLGDVELSLVNQLWLIRNGIIDVGGAHLVRLPPTVLSAASVFASGYTP